MSAQHQQSEQATRTTNITDSYNTNQTINRIFDNAGNTTVYLNSDPDQSTQSGGINAGKSDLMIAAAVVAAALLLKD